MLNNDIRTFRNDEAMTHSSPLLRTFHLVLLCLLLGVCTGCTGGVPFWKSQVSSATPPPEMTTGVATTAATSPPSHPSVTAEPAVLSRTAEPLPRPRQPRSSRFSESIDYTYHKRILTEDTTWRGQVLIEGSLTIAPQATLFITPGTRVRFRPSPGEGAGLLLIRGRIQAIGTKDSPITLTSDEINPAPGDWQGIMVFDSIKKNLLEWCRVDFAVTGITAEFSELALRQTTISHSRTGVVLLSSSVVITGGGAADCMTGFSSRYGDADLGGVRFSGNHRGITVNGGSLLLSASEVTGSEESAVEATGARLRIEGSSFVRNGAGMTLTKCRGDLFGNRIEENRTVGLEFTESPLRITGNRITGNRGTGVVIRSGGGSLWENNLEGNGEGALAVTGTEDVAAPGNWWGSANPDRIRGLIRAGVANGMVLFTPYQEVPPSFP